MRKLLFLTLTALLSASLWAADVTIVENYSTNLSNSASTGRTSFQGKYTEWFYRNARSGGENDKLKDNTKGFWLSRTSGSSCYLESTLEGGIKNVAFNWRQFSTADNGFKFVMNINTKAGSAALVTQQSFTFDGDDTHTNTDQSYSQAIAVKANDVKLTIQNSSTQSDGTTAGGRLIVGPITITPYLLYTQKEVNIVLDQTGYINDQLIDNTESGKVSYSSDATGVAQVNSETGEITPVSVGDATITASWNEGVTTTYTLHVLKAVVETFANVSQGSSSGTDGSTWTTADICNWETKYARRGTNDKMLSKQYTWLTLDGSVRGYIKTTNLEGGIKDVSFNYGQFGVEAGSLLRWQVSAIGTTTTSDVIERDGDLGENRSYSRGAMYSHSFNCAENAQLEILNMSILDDESQPTSNARLLVGDIYITPYLLYTTKEATMDTRGSGAMSYKNMDLIDNTGASVTYSIENYGGIPTDKIGIASDGTVTVTDRYQTGDITVQAAWSAVTTTYTLHVIGKASVNASYQSSEIHATLGEAIPVNELSYTIGYDGVISYASTVPAVADFEAGVLTLKAPGQTKITATLPATSNYTAASASYILTVSYSNYESFNPNGTTSTYAKPEENAQGDMCKWYVYIGGVQTPNYFSSNAITTRAQRTNESKQGYAKSAKLSGGISALAFNYSMMFADNDIENWDIQVYVNNRLVGQLTNEAGGDLDGINGRTLNPMRTKVITGINEPGTFIIRFENHSTVKSEVEYTEGNKGRFAIDNVSWENYDAPIVLNETADNSAILTVNNGETVDVNTNRSLLANVWNTLCLPFDIDKSDLGADADVQVMSSAVIDGEDLTVGFRALSGNILVAGTPYLVKPKSAVSLTGFTDKQITATPGTITQGSVTLTGIFSPTTLTADDKTTLFVGTPDGEGNNLFYPGETGDLKGMRAYFKLSTPLGAPTLRRARFIVNEAQSPTAIEETNRALMQDNRKVMENGHLFIIRDGKKYNVSGQKIQ